MLIGLGSTSSVHTLSSAPYTLPVLAYTKGLFALASITRFVPSTLIRYASLGSALHAGKPIIPAKCTTASAPASTGSTAGSQISSLCKWKSGWSIMFSTGSMPHFNQSIQSTVCPCLKKYSLSLQPI